MPRAPGLVLYLVAVAVGSTACRREAPKPAEAAEPHVTSAASAAVAAPSAAGFDARAAAATFRELLAAARDMSTLEAWQAPSDATCGSAVDACAGCSVRRGQVRASFSFYPELDAGTCTLQGVDIWFGGAEARDVPALAEAAAGVLGPPELIDGRDVARPLSSDWMEARRWQAPGGIAYLRAIAIGMPHAVFDSRRGPLLRDRLDALGSQPEARGNQAPDFAGACKAAGLEHCDISVSNEAAPAGQALRSSLDEALRRLASLDPGDAARAPLVLWLDHLAEVAGAVLAGAPDWDAWRKRFENAGIRFSQGYDGLVPDRVLLRGVALRFPRSPWGQRAFVMCLRDGRDLPYGTADAHVPVIANAEAYLREHPDSPIAGDVLLELGLARETAWALSIEKQAPSDAERLAALEAYRRWKPTGEREDLWRRIRCFLLERKVDTDQRAYDRRGC